MMNIDIAKVIGWTAYLIIAIGFIIVMYGTFA